MSATPIDEVSPVSPGEGLNLVLPSRHAPAGEGWIWVAEGWRLFARSPLMWIIAVVLVFILTVLVHLIPIIGSIVFNVVSPVFMAGFMVASRSLERGGDFDLEHLFAGFRNRLGSLLVVGMLFLVGEILLVLVFAAFVGFSILSAVLSGNTENWLGLVAASSSSILLGALVVCALMIPLVAAYWFAPVLVVMHGLAPLGAMRESLVACFRNFVPFLVYGIVMLIAAIVAAIPFGLGFLVWVPVAIASTYAAYRAIFTEGGIPAQVPAAATV